MTREYGGGVEITFKASARIDDIVRVVKLYHGCGRDVLFGSIEETADKDLEEFNADIMRSELQRLREKGLVITVILIAIADEHKQDLIDIARIYDSPHSSARVRLNGRDVKIPKPSHTTIEKLKLLLAKLLSASGSGKFPDVMAPRP